MSGTLTKIDEYEPDVFTTPGTATASSPAVYYPYYNKTYPYYNKTMGIIDLPYTPAADFYSYFDIVNPNTGQMQEFTEWKLRFNTPFKYALNPDADLYFFEEPRVAVLFRGENSYDGNQVYPTSAGGFFDWFGAVEAKDPNGSFIYRSNYIPLSRLNDYTFRFVGTETYDELWYTEPFALKFRFNFGVVSDPTAQNVLHVQTYPMKFDPVYGPNQIPNTGTNGCYGPTFFQQISPSELTSLCTSSTYTQCHAARTLGGGLPAVTVSPTPATADGLTLLSLSPNPASNNSTVKYNAGHRTERSIRVVNAQGRIVKQWLQYYAVERGTCTNQVYVNDLAAGLYLIEFISGSQKVSKKFSVIK